MMFFTTKLTKVDIWKDMIIKQVVIKFGSLEIDNDEDTVMCFNDPTCCVRTHHCISTAIYLQTTKFHHNLFYHKTLLAIYFNDIPYLILQVMTIMRPFIKISHNGNYERCTQIWHLTVHVL